MRIYIVQRLHKEVDVYIMGRPVGVRIGSVDGAVGILWAFLSEDEAEAFAEGAPVIVATVEAADGLEQERAHDRQRRGERG